MAGRRDYGFLRSYASIGRDPTQFRNMMQQGYGGVLIDYNDPYLQQAVAAAQSVGLPFGFWGDPGVVGNDPTAFAQRFASLNNQYNPSLLVPDIEFVGKGYEGSSGWNWNQRAADEWRKYLGDARTAVTVMPMQQDFNYGAWGKNTEWLPQAYGANPLQEVFSPQDIVQTLISRGVDPNLISPVLGPGHTQGYGGSALWTIDDFAPYGRLPFPKASGPVAQQQASGKSGSPTGSTSRYVGPPTVLGRGASQSTGRVADQGLMWGGQRFGSQNQFAKYLAQRGQSYDTWAQNHPYAAAGLQQR